MWFYLKKSLRYLGFSKVILSVVLIQAVSSHDAHADGWVEPVFAASTSIETGVVSTIRVSLLNKVSYSSHSAHIAYVPVSNVILKFTPTKGDDSVKYWQDSTVLTGLKFVSSGTGCDGDGHSVTCVVPALGGGQTGNLAFAVIADPKIYAANPFINENGSVRVRIDISYTATYGGTRPYTQPNSYLKNFPVVLNQPVVPTPTATATATPTNVPPIVPTATPTPVAPDAPPIAPDPNSEPLCGTVISEEACTCLGCKDEDIFDSKAELDKIFKLAATEATNAVAKFKKYESGKRTSVIVRSSNKRIKDLLEEFADLLKEMGDSNFVCDSIKYCLEVSNEELISDIEYTLDEMKNVSIAITRKLRKLPNSAKDVREIRLAALSNFAEGLEALEDLPAVTSVCSQTDAAVVCEGAA